MFQAGQVAVWMSSAQEYLVSVWGEGGGREREEIIAWCTPVMWIKINIDVIFINVVYLNLFIKHDMEGANVI